MKLEEPCICERCNAEHYGGNYFLCPDCELTRVPPSTIVIGDMTVEDWIAGPPTFDIFTLKPFPKMETR